MAKFCSNCGSQLNETAVFCSSCGTKMGQTFPSQANYVQPTQQAPAHVMQPSTVPQQPAQPYMSQQPPLQQVQNPVMTLKQQTLYNAPYALNRPDQPWIVTVEGDSLVARWNWMDARFFSPHEVTNETRNYTFTVTLFDNGTFKEVDITEQKKSGMSMSGGKLSFGSSSNSFKGKTSQKSFSMGIGQNNQTGETGVVSFKFDTNAVKQPIRNYLLSCGFKK